MKTADMEPTFLWYDLETFGLESKYDRIAQFAALRTDMNLNPKGNGTVLYCKLSADYVPDPASCAITGISPKTVKENGIPETDFITRINSMFSVPGTCVVGYNNIKFDDEFIRNALYRNFLDPYEREYKNNCSRWDILSMVRACHDFRPQDINWPVKESGKPSFVLTDLTDANKIEQTGAHDAMVDVLATINIAKLIKQKQPRLFDYAFKIKNKNEIKNLLELHTIPTKGFRPLLYTGSEFTTENGCSILFTPLAPTASYDNSILCFDLGQSVENLLNATPSDFAQFKIPGLFKISMNKCPFITKPEGLLTAEDYIRIGIDNKKCRTALQLLNANKEDILKNILNIPDMPYNETSDVDFQLYSGFFTDSDKRTFSTIRATEPENLLKMNFTFKDPRCKDLLFRYVCRNYPSSLDTETLRQWKIFSKTRILEPPADQINDLKFVERKIEENLNPENIEKLSPKAVKAIQELKDYCIQLRKYLNIS